MPTPVTHLDQSSRVIPVEKLLPEQDRLHILSDAAHNAPVGPRAHRRRSGDRRDRAVRVVAAGLPQVPRQPLAGVAEVFACTLAGPQVELGAEVEYEYLWTATDEVGGGGEVTARRATVSYRRYHVLTPSDTNVDTDTQTVAGTDTV